MRDGLRGDRWAPVVGTLPRAAYRLERSASDPSDPTDQLLPFGGPAQLAVVQHDCAQVQGVQAGSSFLPAVSRRG